MTAIVAVPFSTTTLFVAPVVVFGLLVAACIDRAYQRVRELLVVGFVIAGVLAVYFALAVRPNVNDKLRAYWSAMYLRGSFGHTMGDVWRRLTNTHQLLGAGGSPGFASFATFLLVALFAAGVVVLAQVRARSIAVAMPLLWAEMIVVGHAQRYPFLDQRTSQFLFVSSLVVIALGAVGVVGLLSRLWVSKHPLLGTGLAVAAGLALVGVFVHDFVPYVRMLNIRPEDVRSQTLAVAARRKPHDVILVNSAGNFGFAYYWPHHPRLHFESDDTGQGFTVDVPGVNEIYVPKHDYDTVLAGMREALARLRAAPPGGRLFIVRTHLNAGDPAIWQHVFHTLHVAPREDVVGVEPLLVLDRSALGPPARRS